jgi:hypothetical protein
VAVEGDQVDLTVAGADVAREDREAESLQVLGRQSLAETAERSAGVFARGARRGWSGCVAGGDVHDRQG